MRTNASERKKRQRARERKGEVVARVTVSTPMIEVLIDLGRLAEHESEDRGQIGCAIASVMDDLVISHRPEKSVTRGQPNGGERGLIASTNSDYEDRR